MNNIWLTIGDAPRRERGLLRSALRFAMQNHPQDMDGKPKGMAANPVGGKQMLSYKFGNSTMFCIGPWAIGYKVSGVVCPDGRSRTVRLTAEPDTFFSIPAAVKIRGKTVSGHVSVPSESETLYFYPNKWGKNAHAFDA